MSPTSISNKLEFGGKRQKNDPIKLVQRQLNLGVYNQHPIKDQQK